MENMYSGINDSQHKAKGDIVGDMTIANSCCNRFSRRTDVNMFNMMDYTSCENCRHLGADNRCIVGQQQFF